MLVLLRYNTNMAESQLGVREGGFQGIQGWFSGESVGTILGDSPQNVAHPATPSSQRYSIIDPDIDNLQ